MLNNISHSGKGKPQWYTTVHKLEELEINNTKNTSIPKALVRMWTTGDGMNHRSINWHKHTGKLFGTVDKWKLLCVYCRTEQRRKYIDIIVSPVSCYRRSKKQVLKKKKVVANHGVILNMSYTEAESLDFEMLFLIIYF